MHVLVQLVVPGSQSDDELYLGERLKGVVYVGSLQLSKAKAIPPTQVERI